MEIIGIAALGLVMGFVTAVSGGAGVFAVPTLLALGMPSLNVLTLNRMSDVGVVLGAARNYWKANLVDWKLTWKMIPVLALGAFIGANIITNVPEQFLKYIIICGVVIGMIFLIKPTRPFIAKHETNKEKRFFGFIMMFVVGIWSGALAMAGATFAVLVLVHLFGKEYLQARGMEVIAAIPETLISTAILLLASNVDYRLLITMGTTSFIGAHIGSKLAIKHGSSFIKKGMILIGIVMIAKLIFKF